MKSPDRESCLRIRGPLVLLSILFGFSGGPAFAGNSLTHYEIMESLGFTGNASEAVAEAEGLLDALDTDRDQNLSFDEWAAPFPYGDLFLETLWESFNTNQDDVVSLSEWTNLAFLWSTEPADESTTFLLDVPDSMANIRINELQWVGSHNSYHIRPGPPPRPPLFQCRAGTHPVDPVQPPTVVGAVFSPGNPADRTRHSCGPDRRPLRGPLGPDTRARSDRARRESRNRRRDCL